MIEPVFATTSATVTTAFGAAVTVPRVGGVAAGGAERCARPAVTRAGAGGAVELVLAVYGSARAGARVGLPLAG